MQWRTDVVVVVVVDIEHRLEERSMSVVAQTHVLQPMDFLVRQFFVGDVTVTTMRRQFHSRMMLQYQHGWRMLLLLLMVVVLTRLVLIRLVVVLVRANKNVQNDKETFL